MTGPRVPRARWRDAVAGFGLAIGCALVVAWIWLLLLLVFAL